MGLLINDPKIYEKIIIVYCEIDLINIKIYKKLYFNDFLKYMLI